MSTRRQVPDYRCPGCEELAGLVVGEEQAVCDTPGCLFLTFNPSLLYDLEDVANATHADLSGLYSPQQPQEGEDRA